MNFRQFSLICVLFFLPVPGLAGQAVTVFAAASLRGALDDVSGAYDGDVVISYGGSGQIARQIARGAPADVVILANTAWMDWLEDRAFIRADTRSDLFGNRLVVVGPVGSAPLNGVSVGSLGVRLADRRLAIGQTQGVPVGIYGRQWLENAGIWDQVAPQLAETENVRAALALVARGEAPLGIVYATDARAEPNVVILHEIPGDLHDPIIYPAAEIAGNTTSQVAEFMEFLASEAALEIFEAHGFVRLGS